MADTSIDLTVAAKFFQSTAISINQRVQDNLQILEFHEIQELSNKAQELFIKSKTMFAQATVQIGQEAKTSFESIEAAQVQINEVIQKVTKVQDVIDFSVKLVSTASSIISGDIGGIVSNGKAVLAGIKALLPPKSTPATA